MQRGRKSSAVTGIHNQHTLLAGLMLRTPFAFGQALNPLRACCPNTRVYHEAPLKVSYRAVIAVNGCSFCQSNRHPFLGALLCYIIHVTS